MGGVCDASPSFEVFLDTNIRVGGMMVVLIGSEDRTGGGETFTCGFHDERWWEMCSGIHE